MPGELPRELGTLLEVLWQDAEPAMVVIDDDCRIVTANPAAQTMLELFRLRTGDRLQGMSEAAYSEDGRLLLPGERPLERAASGQTVPPTIVLVKFTGRADLRRMLLSGRPIELDSGGPGVLVTWHDMTDSWQAQQRNASELTRLGQLLEGATDHAIIMLDPCGRVTTWSAAASRIHGYSDSEAIGLPYAAFFDSADAEARLPDEILARAVATGRVLIEGKRVRKDGSMFWAQAVVTAMRDESGQLHGFVKVTQDVSDRRATEKAVVQLNAELQQINEELEDRVVRRTAQLESQAAELAASNAELEAFSYSVSHDLRAPLRAMNGYTRMLQDQYGDRLPPDAIGYLHKVQDSAVQMGSLIDALLSFSRLQRQNMSSGPLDMNAMVAGCWESLAPARAGRSIDLVVPDLPSAAGDARLIQQVWLNLLDNAIKYTGKVEQARIEVSADQLSDCIAYQVADNGAGFDMRYAEKLGQVFQRLHRNEDFSGTGIGLALVQRIVNRHGGRLTGSGEPGKGAVMGFTLPMAWERHLGRMT